MGEIDVASVVASILAAFNSGLHVLRRLGRKKRSTSARLPSPEEEEQWLKQSLTKRPSEIRLNYDQHLTRHGRRFAVGDEVAHSSLAHTLLVLNTGLVNLLNHALSKEPKSRASSRRALFNLSETAAVDTLSALSQLSSRLSLTLPGPGLREGHEPGTASKQHRRKKRSPSSAQPAPKRPSPSPLLANGGWVRSKSGSSVISRAEARRARQEDPNVKSRSTSALLGTSTHNIKHERITPDPADNGHLSGKSRRKTEIAASATDLGRVHRLRKEPSVLSVSSIHVARQSQDADDPHCLQKKSHVRTDPKLRVRPTSVATILTTSTKIGEIPESKWHDRVLSPEELASRRMPYIVPAPLDADQPKRKARGFKFWKRDEKRQDIAVN